MTVNNQKQQEGQDNLQLTFFPQSQIMVIFNMLLNVFYGLIIIIAVLSALSIMIVGYDAEECIDSCGLGEVQSCNWFSVECKNKSVEKITHLTK